jgi:hypothetical protein
MTEKNSWCLAVYDNSLSQYIPKSALNIVVHAPPQLEIMLTYLELLHGSRLLVFPKTFDPSIVFPTTIRVFSASRHLAFNCFMAGDRLQFATKEHSLIDAQCEG